MSNQLFQGDDEDEQKLWRQVTMERIMRSMDSALTALYIMTAPEMPKQVYIEDVIERIILFGKYQLQNTIFPEFDPVYRVDPKAKGTEFVVGACATRHHVNISRRDHLLV